LELTPESIPGRNPADAKSAALVASD